MNIADFELVSCDVDLGQCHMVTDFGFYTMQLTGKDSSGQIYATSMRLHVTESLDPLIILRPTGHAAYDHDVNSVGSDLLIRNIDYSSSPKNEVFSDKARQSDLIFFRIEHSQILRAIGKNYNHQNELSRIQTSSERTKRIAFTCHDPNIIGGGNKIIFRWINWLADLGHEVTVYSCGKYAPYWHQVKANFRFFECYDQMFEAINESVVVLYSMWHIAPMLRFHSQGKLIYHIRQTYEANNYGFDADSMFRKKPIIDLLESVPIGVFAVSPHLCELYRNQHGINAEYVPNGIDLKMFRAAEKQKTDIKRVVIKSVGEPTYFLKGAYVLKDALILLAKRKPHLELFWEIATGFACPSPTWIGLPENLTFTVRIALKEIEMREFYQEATIFVNPSLYEGFGLPTLEAMACGVPVVHSDNGGLHSIVLNEINSLLVSPQCPDDLADAILRLIENRELAERLAAEGMRTAEKFSLAASFNYLYGAFQKVLQIKYDSNCIRDIQSCLWNDGEKIHEPLVSVVIPSYNQAQYLSKALDSLLSQTYTNWEAVVVNDGSTDHTDEVIENYRLRDSRIKGYFKQNGGITSALNEGLKYAQGDYFCWLSSDDLFYPDKLKLQIDAYKDLPDGYGIVYGSFDILHEEEQRLEQLPFAHPLMRGAEFPEGFRFDFIDGCTIMIPMKIMREIDGFNPYFRHAQDFELWVRIGSLGYRFHLLANKLTIRRVHKLQSSTTNIIFCQFDAASIIDYYIRHFHLLEVYRFFDFNNEIDRNRFVEHLVERTTHTDTHLNHPLIQKNFCHWLFEGLSVFPLIIQNEILDKLLERFKAHQHITARIGYYVLAIEKKIAGNRVYYQRDYSHVLCCRNIRDDDRSTSPIIDALFEYGVQLLVNKKLPLFTQELTLHDMNKLVDNHYKLGHASIRYLSQFKNKYQQRASRFAALEKIPVTQRDATKIFVGLKWPEYEELLAKLVDDVYDRKSRGEVQKKIFDLPFIFKLKLHEMMMSEPTDPILHYWHAMVLAQEGDYTRAYRSMYQLLGSDINGEMIKGWLKEWKGKIDFIDLFIIRNRGQIKFYKLLKKNTPESIKKVIRRALKITYRGQFA